MAYNLQSLITILQQILNPEQSRWIRFQNVPQLQSLLEKAESLQQILVKSSPSKIKDVEQVTQELDYVIKQVVKLGEGNKMSSGSSSSDTSFSSSKSVVVGVDEDLFQLKDRLTGMERKLEIVPIVGMGGIGKTTLARKLYQDSLIVEHFEFLAWATISQDYNMKAILSSLLRCIVGKDQFDEESESDELTDVLYRSLYGRKFMVVLDDIWSTKFWDEIRRYFPDNNNGSRIVITTRESDVAKYADSQSLEHQVQLLNPTKSWNLLRQIVFGEEDCSDHVLQGIGEKIASDCGGLPLAITVIGGLLFKLERSQDIWENIAKDVRAAIGEIDEQCSNILSLSYNHLSNHLKPCFLYMGAFPEDYEIKTSTLVRMWIAEGFVKANGDKRTLEEEAHDYLKALVERNLLLVRHFSWNGKPKSFSMHDLLRDLCISIAIEDKFLNVKHAPNVFTVCGNPRRVCFDTSYSPHHAYDSIEIMPDVRSFVSTNSEILSPMFFVFRLLRVLHILEKIFEEFPTQVLQLVNLRYLAIRCNSFTSPIGISRLCNLQTLIAYVKSCYMPREIWEMSELRHIKLLGIVLFEEDDMKKHVLKKVQTLFGVRITESPMWKDFFRSFPNVKKMKIEYLEDIESVEAVDLSHLHKLENLTCNFANNRRALSTLIFPSSLKRLHLCFGSMSSRELSTLCDLPNLEALILSDIEFETEEDTDEEEWELAKDDEFRSLRFLHLDNCDLVHWRADETNFPVLRHLSLTTCLFLGEIPSGIGEIPTLQLIKLHYCSSAVVGSAKQIQEVQQSDYGNYDIQVRIDYECERESF